jgi:hypothetical protein
MDYYDLVDTLVTVRPSTGLQDYYRALMDAKKAYTPRGNFKVLTAQPGSTANLAREVVRELFPNALDTHVVSSTAAKIIWLRTLRAASYTDSDPKVLAKIAKELPNLDLYRIVDGRRVRA